MADRDSGPSSSSTRTTIVVPLNHAGASPSPHEVIQRIQEHLALEQEVGGYAAAADCYDEHEAVYTHVAELLDCQTHEVAIVDSATTGWTRLFHSFVEYLAQRYRQIRPTDDDDDVGTAEPQQSSRQPPARRRRRRVIFVSQVEYAANLVAACQWVKQRSYQDDDEWTIAMLPSVPRTGKVDVAALNDILQGANPSMDPSTIAMVCVTHVPTNSGVVNPINDIGRVLQSYNEAHRSISLPSSFAATAVSSPPPPVLFLVDACQSLGQMPVSVRDCCCHGMVGTGRKWLRGPRGTGFLFCSTSLLGVDMCPHPVDHFGAPVLRVPATLSNSGGVTEEFEPIQDVLEYAVRPDARRFEFWESSVANRLGLGVAVRHALDHGIGNIQRSTMELATYLHQKLVKIDGIRTLYPPECGIVTFWVDPKLEGGKSNDEDNRDVCERLRNDLLRRGGFEVIVSPPTSTPLDSSITHAPNLVRVSPSYTNTKDDIDNFIACLRSIVLAESQDGRYIYS